MLEPRHGCWEELGNCEMIPPAPPRQPSLSLYPNDFPQEVASSFLSSLSISFLLFLFPLLLQTPKWKSSGQGTWNRSAHLLSRFFTSEGTKPLPYSLSCGEAARII